MVNFHISWLKLCRSDIASVSQLLFLAWFGSLERKEPKTNLSLSFHDVSGEKTQLGETQKLVYCDCWDAGEASV